MEFAIFSMPNVYEQFEKDIILEGSLNPGAMFKVALHYIANPKRAATHNGLHHTPVAVVVSVEAGQKCIIAALTASIAWQCPHHADGYSDPTPST